MSNLFVKSFIRAGLIVLMLRFAPFALAAEAAYLPAGQPDAVALLAPPPPADSAEQAADLAETVTVHQGFGTDETDADWSKKKLLNFCLAGTNGVAPAKESFSKTKAFFKQVDNETSDAVDTAKEYWKRPRPYTVKPDLLAGGKTESSFSYPSGHSTGGMVTALLLAELFPERAKEILEIGRKIGWHRVELGRHYPTDVMAGRVFAQAIVREMKRSADFQRDFAAIKQELAAEGLRRGE